VALALPLVIRDGVVVEMAAYTANAAFDHFPLGEQVTISSSPLRELVQGLRHFGSTRPTLHFEVAVFSLAVVMRETQECEFFRFLALLLCISPGITPELHASGLVFGQFQPELGETFLQFPEVSQRIASILVAAHEIICIAKKLGYPFTLWLYATFEPQVQRVVQIDIG
jgi:hypothetical protein